MPTKSTSKHTHVRARARSSLQISDKYALNLTISASNNSQSSLKASANCYHTSVYDLYACACSNV